MQRDLDRNTSTPVLVSVKLTIVCQDVIYAMISGIKVVARKHTFLKRQLNNKANPVKVYSWFKQ